MSTNVVYEHDGRYYDGVLWNEMRSVDKAGVFKALLFVHINNLIHLAYCEKHTSEPTYKGGLLLPFSVDHACSFVETYNDYLASHSAAQADMFKDTCATILGLQDRALPPRY